jgi:hypothetical protein
MAFLRQQGVDTTTPAGKAMFQMMGVFAEFERAMIQFHRGPSLSHSFDHLVGAGEKRRRDFEAERLGGLEVDH